MADANESAIYQRFDSEADFRAAVLQVIRLAGRQIRILDTDLQRLPLHGPDATVLLANFVRRAGPESLLVALHEPGYVQRHSPRLVQLLERHSGAIQIRQVPDNLRHLADGHTLADCTHGARRFHRDFPRGSLLLHNPSEVTPWWQRFDELWALSTPLQLTGSSGL
jgi:AcrR family transcriptional regulator